MHVRAYVHARAPAPVPGRARVRVRGPGPGPDLSSLPGSLFESGSVNPTRPQKDSKTPTGVRLRERIRPFANRCRKTDRAVDQLRRFCPNRRNCWDLADENTPPERYKKRSRGPFSKTPIRRIFLSSERSLSLSL